MEDEVNDANTYVPDSLPPQAGNKQMLDQLLENFWITSAQEIEEMEDFKAPPAFPLARIKKIMKTDNEVKMISAEAPALFAKACELFILEIAHRTWMHTGSSRRRTIQRSDIAIGINKSDMFDFLIDIVPREEIKPMTKKAVEEANNGNLGYQFLYQQPYTQSGFEGDTTGSFSVHDIPGENNNSFPNFIATPNVPFNTTTSHSITRDYSNNLYNPNYTIPQNINEAMQAISSIPNSTPQMINPDSPSLSSIPHSTHSHSFPTYNNHPTNPLSIETLLRQSGDQSVSQLDLGNFVHSNNDTHHPTTFEKPNTSCG